MVHSVMIGACLLIAAAEAADDAAKSKGDGKQAAGVAAAELVGKFAEESKAAKPRLWSDRSGKHSVTASLIEVRAGKVRLKRSNGQVAVIDFEKLTDIDQLWLRAASRSIERRLTEKELDEPDYSEVDKLIADLEATGVRSLEPGLSPTERARRQLEEAKQGPQTALRRARLEMKIELARGAAINNTPRDQQKKVRSYLASARQQKDAARAMQYIEKALALHRAGPEVAAEMMDAIDALRQSR